MDTDPVRNCGESVSASSSIDMDGDGDGERRRSADRGSAEAKVGMESGLVGDKDSGTGGAAAREAERVVCGGIAVDRLNGATREAEGGADGAAPRATSAAVRSCPSINVSRRCNASFSFL